MTIDLDAIKGRLEQATPGPWHQGPHYRADIESRYGRVAECGVTRGQQAVANAAFIAHAPEDIADLLAEVERLRQERDRYENAQCVTCAKDLDAAAESTVARLREALTTLIGHARRLAPSFGEQQWDWLLGELAALSTPRAEQEGK